MRSAARHREGRGLVAGDQHVQRLGRPRRAPHRGAGIDVGEASTGEREPGGLVHPGVDERDEERGGRAAHRDHHAGEQVHAARDAAAAVEVDAEEDGLGEEGVTLERERQPDRLAGRLHEARPEQAELERQHGARHGPDGEQDRGALRQALGELRVVVIARACGQDVGDHHQQRQRDPDGGEDDVEAERHPHAQARIGEGVHAPQSDLVTKCWVARNTPDTAPGASCWYALVLDDE
jgi:hypothetical protein